MRISFLLLPILLSGCSLFSLKKEKLNIPSAPQRGFDEMEDIRKNIDVISDISHIAYTSGVNAQSYESKTLLKSAKVLQTVAGLPTEPINWKLKKEVENLHDDILENESRYRKEKAHWEQSIARLQEGHEKYIKENSTLRGMVEKLEWWFWFFVIVLIVITFLCPTLGVKIVGFFVGKAKKTAEVALVETTNALENQFSQVVKAIDDYKEKDPEHSTALLESLQKETDSHTRELIRKLKNK